jgi:hypothetical protein
MKLFGRKWSIVVDRLNVSDLDMSFTVEKTLKPEPNTCELNIWNLNEEHRAQLESLRPKKNALVGIPVKIEAGYDAATSLIWLGDLRTVESVKIDADWLTTLGCGDGEKAIKNARVNLSFNVGARVDTVLRGLAKAMGVGLGNTELFAARLLLSSLGAQIASQGLVVSGSAADQLTAWCRTLGLEWSIQDGALMFLEFGEPLPTQVLLLSPSTGLIGSPTVDNEGQLTVTMLMIPGVMPGSFLVLNSDRIKGNYRVISTKHTGDTFGTPWYIEVVAERY